MELYELGSTVKSHCLLKKLQRKYCNITLAEDYTPNIPDADEL